MLKMDTSQIKQPIASCKHLDDQGQGFLGRPLDHCCFPWVFLDGTYLHGSPGKKLQVSSRATSTAALNYSASRGLKVGGSDSEPFWREFIGDCSK